MNPLQTVHFVQHGGVCLVLDGVTVYVDPLDLDDDPHDADVVIITHAQASRYSPADIAKVRQDDTCFVASPAVAAALENAFGIDSCYRTIVDSETPTVYLECGVGITPVPAYHGDHPVSGSFGAFVHLGRYTYYFSGNTDMLATDMKCDILFLACDKFYTLASWETVLPRMIADMDVPPALVIPYHSGGEEPQAFAEQVRGVLEAAGIACAQV